MASLEIHHYIRLWTIIQNGRTGFSDVRLLQWRSLIRRAANGQRGGIVSGLTGNSSDAPRQAVAVHRYIGLIIPTK